MCNQNKVFLNNWKKSWTLILFVRIINVEKYQMGMILWKNKHEKGDHKDPINLSKRNICKG